MADNINQTLSDLSASIEAARLQAENAEGTPYAALILAQLETLNTTQSEILRQIGVNLPFVQMLKRLDNIAATMAICCDKSPVPSDLYIPIIFKDETEASDHKCKGANMLWQGLRDLCGQFSPQYLVDIVSAETSDAIEMVRTTVGEFFPPADWMLSTVSALVIMLKTGDYSSYFTSLISQLDANKEAFIMALYNAENATEARANSIATLGALAYPEKVFLNLLFTERETKELFNPGFSWPTPDNPIICAAADCVDIGYYTNAWGYGLPALLEDGGSVFTDGETTATSDTVVWKVSWVTPQMPTTFSALSITTPSVDVVITQCDGTVIDQNEVLASAFPLTFEDAISVQFIRSSSAFTIDLEFTQ